MTLLTTSFSECEVGLVPRTPRKTLIGLPETVVLTLTNSSLIIKKSPILTSSLSMLVRLTSSVVALTTAADSVVVIPA